MQINRFNNQIDTETEKKVNVEGFNTNSYFATSWHSIKDVISALQELEQEGLNVCSMERSNYKLIITAGRKRTVEECVNEEIERQLEYIEQLKSLK